MDDKYIVDVAVWRSSFEAPMVGSAMTYMICKYTDGLQPEYEFGRHLKDSWRNQEREVITRPFVWTRIPE
jgi:hypothetical protein